VYLHGPILTTSVALIASNGERAAPTVALRRKFRLDGAPGLEREETLQVGLRLVLRS
jgi:hypothetical protein